jgi:hypothetical protein
MPCSIIPSRGERILPALTDLAKDLLRQKVGEE